MNKQERDRKVEAMAGEIYVRTVTGMLSQQFDGEEIARNARAKAEAFYPQEDETPPASVPIKKAAS